MSNNNTAKINLSDIVDSIYAKTLTSNGTLRDANNTSLVEEAKVKTVILQTLVEYTDCSHKLGEIKELLGYYNSLMCCATEHLHCR